MGKSLRLPASPPDKRRDNLASSSLQDRLPGAATSPGGRGAFSRPARLQAALPSPPTLLARLCAPRYALPVPRFPELSAKLSAAPPHAAQGHALGAAPAALARAHFGHGAVRRAVLQAQGSKAPGSKLTVMPSEVGCDTYLRGLSAFASGHKVVEPRPWSGLTPRTQGAARTSHPKHNPSCTCAHSHREHNPWAIYPVSSLLRRQEESL